MVSDNSSEDAPAPDPSAGDELLREWERGLANQQDPLTALANVLLRDSGSRQSLFQRIGDTLLGYRLERILGAGGMGVTYAARRSDGALAAVKLVSTAEGIAAGRFELECRLLQELDHEAIVPYREHAVMKDGTGVLCMDLVEGVDLEQVFEGLETGMQSRPVSSLLMGIDDAANTPLESPRVRRRLLRLLATVAEGLFDAHSRGVVHRDVKPANILVRDDLSPVLIDFGLARDHFEKVSLTGSGAAVGTIAYMAPEQLNGSAVVDARADIYSMGRVLLRALCGKEEDTDVRSSIGSRRRPFLLDAGQSRTLSVDQQAILYQCLDPRPDRRYATARELAEDLRAAAGAGPVRARRPGSLRRFARRRARLAALVAAGVLLLAVCLWWLRPEMRRVRFLANSNAQDAHFVLPGGRKVYINEEVDLPVGSVDFRFEGDEVWPVEATRTITSGEGVQSVVVFTHDLTWTDKALIRAGHAIVHFMSGHNVVPMALGIAKDERFIDGAKLSTWHPYDPLGLLAPGLHTFRAVDGHGRVEEQTLELNGEPADVQLLPAVMSDVDGQYRKTWSTVWSPRSKDIELSGSAQRWFGRSEPSVIGGGGLQAAMSAFTPPVRGQESTLQLRCSLRATMRSAIVYLRGSCEQSSSLVVTAGFEGEEPKTWPLDASGSLVPRMSFRSEQGSSTFVVHARMRSEDPVLPNRVGVRFLEGMVFGGHWKSEPPCFAIVCDPGVIDPPLAPKLIDPHGIASAAKGIRLPSVLEQADNLVIPPDALQGEQVLVGGVGADGARRMVMQRVPDGAVVSELLATDVRVPAKDGVQAEFGKYVAYVADLDGDGKPELAIGDPSSQRRGRINSGILDLVASSDGRVLWSWPRETWDSEFGDDVAGAVWPAGDWRSDGRQYLALGAFGAASKEGLHKAGRIEVVDAATGEVVWSLLGQQKEGCLTVRDSLVVDTGNPSTLLLQESRKDSSLQQTVGILLSVADRFTGIQKRHELPVDANAAGVLVADEDEGASIVITRIRGSSTQLDALERYVLKSTGWRMVARKWIHVSSEGADVPRLLRLPDLDDDGVSEVAAILKDANGGWRLWFLSGFKLSPISTCKLDFECTSNALTWLPGNGDRPGQLLLVQRSGSNGKAQLQGFVPR